MNLHALFAPRSIAVVGASTDRTKLGNIIFRNCRDFGYSGTVYPINLHETEVEGERAYPTVGLLPRRPDLVIIATPAPTVPQIVRDLSRSGIPAASIISAGFREIGGIGMKWEEQMALYAAKPRMALLGPNCLGFIAPSLKLNASFAQGLPRTGNVSIISQSGAMAVAIADWASSSGLGFRYLISLGNKAVVNECDVLRYLAADPATKVVLMYLEDIRNGRAFLREAARVARRLPIIVIKAGRTEAAAAAVASHTGALVSSGSATVAALRSAGCLVVDTIEEWFDLARAFSHMKRPLGPRVAVVTNAGGPGILATDAVGRAGLEMSALMPGTLAKLRSSLPAAAALHNPVDVVGDATPERYQKALQAVVRDGHVDVVVAILTHQQMTDSMAIARGIDRVQRATSKPVYCSFLGGTSVQESIRYLQSRHLPIFSFPESAVGALARVLMWKKIKPQILSAVPASHAPLRSLTGSILGQNALSLLAKYGVSIPPGKVVHSIPAAVAAARKLGFPVVMKVISRHALHKTDVKGVVVDVHSEAAAEKTARDFLKHFGRKFEGRSEGIFVQPHILGALEVFVGGVHVPDFGPMILFGLGGIFVEKLHAVVYAPAPLTSLQARSLIKQSALWPILQGTRGKTYALHSLERTLAGISQFIAKHPEVSSLDCNPVMLTQSDAQVVDARMIISPYPHAR